MTELKLTANHLRELHKKGYSSDMAHFLNFIENGESIDEICKDVPKLMNVAQSLQRKELVSDVGNITKEGKDLLSFLSLQGESVKLVKKKPSDEPFTLWWSTFPSNDTFDYKGRHFPGTRSLKAKKDDCKAKLYKILNEAEYTIDELVKAIELEVHQKKENSIKTGQNKLSFMQNSMTYLNQFTYESFIELVRKGNKIKEEVIHTGGTDI